MEPLSAQNDRQDQNHTYQNQTHQNHADLLQLAYQGNEQAIATLMNRHLKQRHIIAQVAWEESCLHILLEAAHSLPPEPLASVIHKTILKIQVEKLRSLKVSFRLSGANEYAWSQERAIAHTHSPGFAAPAVRQSIPVAPSSLADWLNQQAQADVKHHYPLSKAADEETALRFLRFSFSSTESALLPLISIRQVVSVSPQSILPIPAMPPSVVGVYNFRGEMLWLVDLGLQIGFRSVMTKATNVSSQTPAVLQVSRLPKHVSGHLAIVIQAQGKSLGLLIPDVVDIENHSPKHLHPPGIDLFPSELVPFLQGYLVRPSSPVLDASALINDRRLQVHAA